MGNFDFVQQTLPSVHHDCARAESYVSTDTRSACFYSRRAIEGLVKHLYDILDLPAPYNDDLAARINAPAFKVKTGVDIGKKWTSFGWSATKPSTSPRRSSRRLRSPSSASFSTS